MSDLFPEDFLWGAATAAYQYAGLARRPASLSPRTLRTAQ